MGGILYVNGCGSKLNRRGKPQVLLHVSTYRPSILGTGYLSQRQIPINNGFKHSNPG